MNSSIRVGARAGVGFLFPLLAGCVTAAEPPAVDRAAFDRMRAGVDRTKLRKHVEFLAGSDLNGRLPNSAESALARDYLVAAFKELGLKPVFGESYLQPGEDVQGKFVNVAALLPAEKPDAEIVAVVAHYDHLGKRGNTIYPGADDNAAAVALLLETARLLAADKTPRKCSVMFLCPDAEETGLRGSAYFAKHPPVPMARFRAAIVMDLVGNDPSAKLTGKLFVMGTEGGAELAKLAESVPGSATLTTHRLSIGMIEAVPFSELIRAPVSDYDAFRTAGRPFVFLSCGRSPKYHTPADTPETLNFPKMAEVAKYLVELTARTADLPGPIEFRQGRYDLPSDIGALRTGIDALTAGEPGELNPKVVDALKKDAETLAGFADSLKAGKLAPEQVRKIQMISIRLQYALWHPESTLALGF